MVALFWLAKARQIKLPYHSYDINYIKTHYIDIVYLSRFLNALIVNVQLHCLSQGGIWAIVLK
jgi:hypothetical protein